MNGRGFSLLTWSLLILFAGVLPALYHTVLMPVAPAGSGPSLFERGISTPLLLWLNGYLGMFFNYRFLGAMNWMAIPILLWSLWNWRTLMPWQRGLVLFYILAVGIIGGVGGFNYRYALTLQPLTVVGSSLVVWRAFERTGRGSRERWAFFVLLAAFCVVNSMLSMEHRQRVWRATPGFSSPDTGRGSLRERLDSGPRDLDGWLLANGVAVGDMVLVNNLPIYYYRTGRPGLYYWCGSDQLFTDRGPLPLLHDRTDEEVASYLTDSLHCSVIFSTRELNTFDPRWLHFLNERTTQVAIDGRGYTIHRVKDNFPR